MTDATKEMLKSGARLVVLAVVSTLINYVLTIVLPTLNLSPEIVGYITLALHMIDKWVHENKQIKANGLVPF